MTKSASNRSDNKVQRNNRVIRFDSFVCLTFLLKKKKIVLSNRFSKDEKKYF